MIDDFFSYKSRFVTFALLIGYTYIHIKLTGSFVDATINDMINFSVRLPFGQRLLIPAIAHGLQHVLPLSIDELFFLLELSFISLFYFSLIHLLAYEFNPKKAQLLAWLFLIILPLITVINYRYTMNGEAMFYYPYDTPSLFFMAAGLLFCLREKWLYFIPFVALATANRESSILLVLLIPALHWQRFQAVLMPFILSLFAYCLARTFVLHFINGVPGELIELYFRNDAHTHFEINLFWLLNEHNFLLFLFTFAGLPLLWFAFYDYIRPQYKPLRYVIMFYLLGLMIVGDFMESRIFSEVTVLFYLPICTAINRWLSDQPYFYPATTTMLYCINRYAILSTLAFIILFHGPIDDCIIWLSHHI